METKFRAWNGEEMISPDYIDRKGVAWWKENSIQCNAKDKHLMQYTNRKDKNGTEIYVNDFVKDSEIIYLVKFGSYEQDENKHTGFYMECAYDNRFAGGLDEDDEKYLEVCGNLFTNPELLKG